MTKLPCPGLGEWSRQVFDLSYRAWIGLDARRMLSKLLFESPWLMLTASVAVQFVLIAVWSWRRGPVCSRAVWSGFAMFPTVLVLSVVVVTPRERIIRLCRELAALVEVGNVGAIDAHLAEDFEAAGFDRQEFLERVTETLTNHRVDDARLSRFVVTFPGGRDAVAEFHAVCRVRSSNAHQDRLLSRWRLTFRGQGNVWKVGEIEALPTPLSPISNLPQCLP
jgi:hypothetical protein